MASENIRTLSAEFKFWLKHRHGANVKQEDIENFLSTFLQHNNLDILLCAHKKENQVAALFKKSK